MEGSMVTLADKYNTQIKQYIDANFEQAIISESKTHGPFFYTEFKTGEIRVEIQGDIGGFEVKIFIESEKFSLWQYDRSVNEAMKTNDKNIQYQLDVLKRFLAETST